MKIPKYLYRYKSLDGESFHHTLDIILNNRMYTPKAEDLNDPCEGFYTWVENEFKEIGDIEKQKMVRILSFSESYNDNSLWAHYTNGFKGICFEFDAEKIQNKLKYEGGLSQVIYSDSVPQISLTDDKYKDRYIYKSKEWEHEKEWRLITSESNEYFDFNDDFLSSVFLGPKINKNVEKVIIALLKEKSKIPKIKRIGFSTKSYKMIIKQQLTRA